MTTTPTNPATKLTERVAEEIRAAMGRRRITGAELARRLHVSQMWVSYRLNGRQPIDLNDLEAIAEAIGVPIRDLVPDGGDTNRRYGVRRHPARLHPFGQLGIAHRLGLDHPHIDLVVPLAA